MAKLVSFFMSIFYLLSTFGLFPNNPITIHVSDENSNPVSGVTVYYQEKNNLGYEVQYFAPIGQTDENGNIVWENHYFGECKLYVSESADDELADWQNVQVFTISIPLTGNETIELKITGQE